MEISSRTIPLSETSMSYHVSQPNSAGTPIVLLHPWFGCWQFWKSVMTSFPDRPCYAVDFYSPATGDWSTVASPTDLADTVISMLDSENLDQVDLIGNSVGGIVAQIIAAIAPERIRRLILVGTGANTTGALPGFAAAVDRWTKIARSGDVPSHDTVEDTVRMLVTSRPDNATWDSYIQAVRETDPTYITAVLLAARELDLTPQLHRISAPTLIIRGSEDCARTAEHSAALAAGIPTARSIEIAGAGHSPMVDHPAEFLRLVVDHLDAVIPTS